MLQPIAPVAAHDLIDLRVRELLAFDAIASHRALRADLRLLLVSTAVARELAALGYGADESALVDAAGAALQPLTRSAAEPFGLQPGQALEAVRGLLQFHDAQRAAATCRDYHRALARVRAWRAIPSTPKAKP